MAPKKWLIPENLSPESPEMITLVFGVIIEKLRLASTRTLDDLAAFVDLKIPALKRIERGQQLPSPFAQTRFAAAFGITVQELNHRVTTVQALCARAAGAISYAADLRFDRALVLTFVAALTRKEGE